MSEIKESVKNIQAPTYPVRIKFQKTGQLQYISHLDLNRTLARALIRAKVPVWYTEGFNPHPKLIFATPLSVGAESVCEYCDIKTTVPPDCDGIKQALSATLPEGLQILDVYTNTEQPFGKFPTIVFSEYDIRIVTAGGDAALAETCQQLLSASLKITKRSKSGEKEVDLASLISRVSVRFDETSGEMTINIVLPADSANFTNPELVVRALSDKAGILQGAVTEEYYSILRTQLFLSDGVTPFR